MYDESTRVRWISVIFRSSRDAFSVSSASSLEPVQFVAKQLTGCRQLTPRRWQIPCFAFLASPDIIVTTFQEIQIAPECRLWGYLINFNQNQKIVTTRHYGWSILVSYVVGVFHENPRDVFTNKWFWGQTINLSGWEKSKQIYWELILKIFEQYKKNEN